MIEVSIGDPVEVKLARMEGPFWVPATVCFIDDHKIGVAYSNGIRQMLPRSQGLFRAVRKKDEKA